MQGAQEGRLRSALDAHQYELAGREAELAAALAREQVRWGSVALSLRTTAHPLYTSFTARLGTSVSKATMRPNPMVPEAARACCTVVLGGRCSNSMAPSCEQALVAALAAAAPAPAPALGARLQAAQAISPGRVCH